jgi:predicted NAD-dependent protein-ADP-ribosyltransferase YbiA (DUF1768 family)
VHPALIKTIAAEHVRDMQADAAIRRRVRQARRNAEARTHGRESQSPAGCAPSPRLRSA